MKILNLLFLILSIRSVLCIYRLSTCKPFKLYDPSKQNTTVDLFSTDIVIRGHEFSNDAIDYIHKSSTQEYGMKSGDIIYYTNTTGFWVILDLDNSKWRSCVERPNINYFDVIKSFSSLKFMHSELIKCNKTNIDNVFGDIPHLCIDCEPEPEICDVYGGFQDGYFTMIGVNRYAKECYNKTIIMSIKKSLYNIHSTWRIDDFFRSTGFNYQNIVNSYCENQYLKSKKKSKSDDFLDLFPSHF